VSKKKIRIKLVPQSGRFSMLSGTVDGVLAVRTNGTKAEATVVAKRTSVAIEAEGSPQASFHCLVQAMYDDGFTDDVCDLAVVLDLNGSYSEVFAVLDRGTPMPA
jgi:hypothetical protein